MITARVLAQTPLVLDRPQREQYFADGFLAVPGHVGAAWLDRLRAVVATKIEESRALTASDDQFDLAPDHSAAKPNIRRLRKAVDPFRECSPSWREQVEQRVTAARAALDDVQMDVRRAR